MGLSASDPGRAGTSPLIGLISVIICTKDRPADVARAIELVRASGETGRAVEIVVVEEADAPRAIPGVRYVHLAREGRGFGAARNAGVRAAQGEILVFVDDDYEVGPGRLDARRQFRQEHFPPPHRGALAVPALLVSKSAAMTVGRLVGSVRSGAVCL